MHFIFISFQTVYMNKRHVSHFEGMVLTFRLGTKTMCQNRIFLQTMFTHPMRKSQKVLEII